MNLRLITFLPIAALTAGCLETAPELPPAKAELPPGVPSESSAGARYVSLNNISGQQETSVILAVENGLRVVQNETTGCKWGRSADNPVSPSLMWENCNGYTGSRKITSTKGQIFPLKVGNTQTWNSAGTNDKGDTWTDSRTCTVEGTVNVSVPSGNYDAYNVRCTGENRVRHYYFAPAVGRTIKYVDRHTRNNERRDFDNISFDQGT